MHSRFNFAILASLLTAFVSPATSLAQVSVSLVSQDEQFQLLRDGQPYTIKGVGGDTHLAELAAAGGNSIRTWNDETLDTLLDAAHLHKLTVCVGFWLGHQRHGFDYQNAADVLEQLHRCVASVKKYKNHPAVLMWAVGNEMEGEGNDPSVWYAVNHIAREIKKIDPNHPTMTVIAEIGEGASKLSAIENFCPDIDIIGINSYGGIESLAQRYREAGKTRPYVVTEHAAAGPWEVATTSWGAPYELTSTAKGEAFKRGYTAAAAQQSDLCLGSYAFMWGHKQETTATWFGMLLPDGRRLAPVDVMSELWTGKPVKQPVPRIQSLTISGPELVEPGTEFVASVELDTPDDSELKIEWVLRSDSATIGAGGDPQEAETVFESAVESLGRQASVAAPDGGGGYRLFCYVYDQTGGAAVANVPFRVNAPMKIASAMPVSKLPYVIYGEASKSRPTQHSVFVPSGFMGNAGAITMDAGATDLPHSGSTCLKFGYSATASWGGVLWQSPAGDWDGKLPGGANLTGASQLEFWVRGATGGEKVNFAFGALNGNQPYRDTGSGELQDVVLTTKWQKLTIPLADLDLRQIKTGFGWSLAGQEKPVTFFLDDIRFVK